MKKLKRIENVILDCDETLWQHRKDETKIIANALGIPFSKKFDKQFYTIIQKCYSHLKDETVTIQKFCNFVEMYMPILTKYNISPQDFFEVWTNTTETTFVNEDSLKFIHYLKSKKYRIIILSDCFYEKQIKLLDAFQITPYLDEIYTCDDSYLKNNPKSIINLIKPGDENKYVMVGDSLNHDIAFASNAGIRSIWFNPYSMKNNTKFIPTFEVQSLLEICRIL